MPTLAAYDPHADAGGVPDQFGLLAIKSHG